MIHQGSLVQLSESRPLNQKKTDHIAEGCEVKSTQDAHIAYPGIHQIITADQTFPPNATLGGYGKWCIAPSLAIPARYFHQWSNG